MPTRIPSFLRMGLLAAAFACSSRASAHIDMVSPVAREVDQKVGPCGRAGSVRGTKVTTARAGSTLRVTWRETIDHPSHFRISIDMDGDDDFVDPSGYDDRFTNAAVLIDGISDKAGGLFSADVVLPDIACDKCTLQLVQVMYDKKPYEKGTNDLYYRCADLTLTKGDATAPPVDATPDAPGAAEPEASDAGLVDGTESDSNAATGTDEETPQPAPSSQPSSSGEASGAHGYTCDALSSYRQPGHTTWSLALSLCALLIAQRARRRARLMLASSRGPQTSREKR